MLFERVKKKERKEPNKVETVTKPLTAVFLRL